MNVIQIICFSKVFSRTIYDFAIKFITRLHSSRMRTAHALTVSPSMLWGGGGWCLLQGVCSQGGGNGGVCPGGCPLGGGCSGGCLLGGMSAWGDVCLGGCLLGGVSAWGWGVSQHALRQTPPVNRITHACENITLRQLCCGR